MPNLGVVGGGWFGASENSGSFEVLLWGDVWTIRSTTWSHHFAFRSIPPSAKRLLRTQTLKGLGGSRKCRPSQKSICPRTITDKSGKSNNQLDRKSSTDPENAFAFHSLFPLPFTLLFSLDSNIVTLVAARGGWSGVAGQRIYIYEKGWRDLLLFHVCRCLLENSG